MSLSSVVEGVERLYRWVTSLEDLQHLGGGTGAPREAARRWRAQATSLRKLERDLDAGLTAHVSIRPGGSWNDDSARAFDAVWRRYRPGLHGLADEFDQVAAALEGASRQVDAFNDAIVEAIVEIGAWVAFCVATSWIPGVDAAAAAGAVLRGATLMERIVGVLNQVLTDSVIGALVSGGVSLVPFVRVTGLTRL